MKKVIALLLVFIVACGPSESEIQSQIDEAVENALNEANKIDDTTTTTVLDTTTTTIPPAPISEVDFVELFNTKLRSELCNDAKNIDTTSEPCLREYKNNLNDLVKLQDEIGNFATELISYYENYPDLVNDEYKDFINFVENEYSQIFTQVSKVENKYSERFGGIPSLDNFLLENEAWNNCALNYSFSKSENLKSGYILFEDSFNNQIKLDLNSNNKSLLNTGGTFQLKEIQTTNFLGETYFLTNENLGINSIKVNHWIPILHKLTVSKNNNLLTFELSYSHGVRRMDRLILTFNRGGIDSVNYGFSIYSDGYQSSGINIQKEGLVSWDISQNKSVQVFDINQISNEVNLKQSDARFFLRHIIFVNGFEGDLYQDSDLFFNMNSSNDGVRDYSYSTLFGCNGESSIQNISVGGDYNDAPSYIKNLIENSSFIFKVNN